MDMNFLTETILSGVVYDLVKSQTKITFTSLKERFYNYRYKKESLVNLAEEINKIPALEEKSEIALQKAFAANPQIKDILSRITLNPSSTMIVQTHTGSGHNIGGDYVAGNKVVHPKKE